MIEDIKTEVVAGLKSMAGSKVAWFLAGAFLAGNDVPSIVASLRTFVGV